MKIEKDFDLKKYLKEGKLTKEAQASKIANSEKEWWALIKADVSKWNSENYEDSMDLMDYATQFTGNERYGFNVESDEYGITLTKASIKEEEVDEEYHSSERSMDKPLDAQYFVQALKQHSDDIRQDDPELGINLRQVSRSVGGQHPNAGDISIHNVYEVVDSAMYGEPEDAIDYVKQEIDTLWAGL